MQTLARIKQLFDYKVWANAEFARHFQTAAQPDAKALGVFAHLLLAEKIWLFDSIPHSLMTDAETRADDAD